MKKKTLITLVLGTVLLSTLPVAQAAEINTNSGTSQLIITDYAVNPESGLPLNPGAFTLISVPSIDFGKHTLDSLTGINPTFTGTYDQDMTVKDTRPSVESIAEAKSKISAVAADPSKTASDKEIADATSAWNDAVPASPWRIQAKATTLNGIGSSLKIGDTEVLTTSGTVIKETSTIPVGTKSYKLDTPQLTLSTNNIEVKTYNGTITYTAINAI